MQYTLETVEKYRLARQKRAEEAKLQNESRRQLALQRGRELSTMLRDRFAAKKVVLFGSVLSSERFKENSDIDLAVEGIEPENYFSALADCQTGDFPVDLIEIATATRLMKERIARGMVLYERK